MIRYYITSLLTTVITVALVIRLRQPLFKAALMRKRGAVFGWVILIVGPYVLIPVMSYVVL